MLHGGESTAGDQQTIKVNRPACRRRHSSLRDYRALGLGSAGPRGAATVNRSRYRFLHFLQPHPDCY